MNFTLHCSDIDSIQWKSDAKFLPLQNNLHVWLIETKADNAVHSRLQNVLTRDEHVRMNRYRMPDDRLRFLFAHGYKRLLLGKYLNVQPEKITFDLEENNKPFVAGKEIPIHFNFSHSQDKVLFVFHQKEFVGCDAEWIRGRFDYIGFMDHHYSEEEANAISKSDGEKNQRELFFKFWSRKEAWLKTTGLGVFSNLQSVNTAYRKNLINSDTPTLTKFHKDFYMQSFLAGDCYCSVCINGLNAETVFYKI